jgi:hypothetical protein
MTSLGGLNNHRQLAQGPRLAAYLHASLPLSTLVSGPLIPSSLLERSALSLAPGNTEISTHYSEISSFAWFFRQVFLKIAGRMEGKPDPIV